MTSDNYRPDDATPHQKPSAKPTVMRVVLPPRQTPTEGRSMPVEFQRVPCRDRGRIDFVFFWSCVVCLPIAVLDADIKNSCTNTLSMLSALISCLLAFVTLVKQFWSDLPLRIKVLPALYFLSLVVVLMATLVRGIWGGVLEHQGLPDEKDKWIAIVELICPALFALIGLTGLVMLIKHQASQTQYQRMPSPACTNE